MAEASGNSGFGGFGRGAAAGLLVVLALGAGSYLLGYWRSAPSPDAQQTAIEPTGQTPPEPTTVAPQDSAAPSTDPTDTAVADGPTEEDPAPVIEDLQPPRFDVVRMDQDGSTVIAGRATAGSRVRILLDNVEQDIIDVDAQGGFVSLLSLSPSDSPRVLALESALDGQTRVSDDQIILAPVTIADAAVAPVADEAMAAVTQPQARTPTEAGETSAPQQGTAEQPTTPEVASVDAVVPAVEAAATTAPEIADASAPGVADATPQAEETVAAAPSGTEPAVSVAPETPTVAQLPAADAATSAGADAARDSATGAEPAATVAILRSGADGIEVLQPATPELTIGVTLDTISYSDTGTVLLNGRARPQATIRVYLDNRAIADLDTNAEGRWTGALRDVEPGIYTLRLDSLDPQGAVLGRLETPFKRETPEDLQPPAPQTAGGALTETPLIRAVTVQTGDTLWAISRERYGDGVLYVRLFEANRDSIRDPDLIYPGQIFTIPE